MSQHHSRSRTDVDHNYQGGLRHKKQASPSLFWNLLKVLRFVVLWGGLIGLGFLYYQERLWNSALENQQTGYMTLIRSLVKDSPNLNRGQKRQLMQSLKQTKLKRCYILRPFISIECVK